MSVPNPPPLPPPAVPDLADPEKTRLENEKLREEIADIRNARRLRVTVFRSVKATEWVIAAAAVVALFFGWRTGLFDATRQNLAAQQERLQVEKIHLEQQKEKLTTEVTAKQKELDALKARLLPFEHEDAAVQELRQYEKKLMGVRFSVDPAYDGLKISLTGRDAELDWNLIGAARKTRTNPYLTDALKSANKVRTLKGLKIAELSVTASQVQLACEHSEMETFVIDHGDANAAAIGGMRPLPKCTVMVLRDNKIASFAGLPKYPSVIMLDVSNNPLGDDAIGSLVETFPNLTMLSISGTPVTDEGMKTLAKLQSLFHINLRGTRATGQGALKLLDCPRLGSVDIDKEVVSDEQRAVMRKQRPNDSGFLHKNGEYRWGGDW